jgi:hypothetical protein
MPAPDNIACPLCGEDNPTRATRFFVTLGNDLWVVCAEHAQYFEKVTIELDPDQYDFEGFEDEAKPV